MNPTPPRSRRSKTSSIRWRLRQHGWFALCLLLLSALLVFTVSAAASFNFLLKWGGTGGAAGQFISPRGIAVDPSGNVFATDGNNRVQKFDSSGNPVSSFGVGGVVSGGFVSPNRVATDSAGNVYVSDSDSDSAARVQKFSSSGAFQFTFGSPGVGDGQFEFPAGVAVDSSGNIYVADSGNHRIQKFDSSHTFVTKWGSNGTGDTQFGAPQGVAVDTAGNVYVVDSVNNRVQKFTSSGGFITKWGASGGGDGEFSSPLGIAVDTAGNVYVADTGNNRIEVFDSGGTFIESFGNAGAGDGQFASPGDVAIDTAGNLYVADTGNDRVQKFSAAASPPVANAGPDQTVECAGMTPVTLDGSASTAGSGTINSYSWAEGANALGTGAHLNVSLPSGTHTITLTVTDTGGGSDTDDVVVNIVDTTPPVIQINGDNPMTVECHTGFSDPGATATDACAGSVPVTHTGGVTANAPGSYTIIYSASDGANTATATRIVNVVDTTPPAVSCPSDISATLPPNSSATSVAVNYPAVTATDSCSSSVTVNSSPASGSLFNVGTTVVHATASDGTNTSSCSFNVTVLYNFTGFFSPVANLPAINVVNAGRAVPVKFSLSGFKGLNIFAAGSPSSGQIACNPADNAVTVQGTVTAGGSSLSYDASADQYGYVWKTDPSWAGTCRQIVVQLGDGSVHRADFRFR